MPADAMPVAHTSPAASLIAGIIPAGVTTTALTFGPYTDANGAVQFAGMTAKIVPSSKVVQTATGAVIVPAPLTVTLDSTGAASIALANTDAAGLVPSGWTYTLTWQVGRFDATPGNLTFSLPVAAGPTVDFDLLAPITTTVPAAGLDALVAALLTDKTSATYAAALQVPNYPNGA